MKRSTLAVLAVLAAATLTEAASSTITDRFAKVVNPVVSYLNQRGFAPALSRIGLGTAQPSAPQTAPVQKPVRSPRVVVPEKPVSAIPISAPTVAPAEPEEENRTLDGRHDRGLHRGWYIGKHKGWAKQEARGSQQDRPDAAATDMNRGRPVRERR